MPLPPRAPPQIKAAKAAEGGESTEEEAAAEPVVTAEMEEIAVDEEVRRVGCSARRPPARSHDAWRPLFEHVARHQLAKLQLELSRKAKREKRKLLLRKAKQRERMRLQMDVPNDTAAGMADESLFSLKAIRGAPVRCRVRRSRVLECRQIG